MTWTAGVDWLPLIAAILYAVLVFAVVAVVIYEVFCLKKARNFDIDKLRNGILTGLKKCGIDTEKAEYAVEAILEELRR